MQAYNGWCHIHSAFLQQLLCVWQLYVTDVLQLRGEWTLKQVTKAERSFWFEIHLTLGLELFLASLLRLRLHTAAANLLHNTQ